MRAFIGCMSAFRTQGICARRGIKNDAETLSVRFKCTIIYWVFRVSPQDPAGLGSPVKVTSVQRPSRIVDSVPLSCSLAQRAIQLELKDPSHEISVKYGRKLISLYHAFHAYLGTLNEALNQALYTREEILQRKYNPEEHKVSW